MEHNQEGLEVWVGRFISPKSLYTPLTNLIDMSIIRKKNGEYSFIDPIYEEASKQL